MVYVSQRYPKAVQQAHNVGCCRPSHTRKDHVCDAQIKMWDKRDRKPCKWQTQGTESKEIKFARGAYQQPQGRLIQSGI